MTTSLLSRALPPAAKHHIGPTTSMTRIANAYGSTSEYIRELIRRDLDRTGLRDLLLAGTASEPAVDVDDSFLDGLRRRARQTSGG